MNTIPNNNVHISPQEQTYPSGEYIDIDLRDRAKGVLVLTLEKDMFLATLGVAMDINNIISPNPQENNQELTSLIAGAVCFMHPQDAANDTAYGLKCELVFQDVVVTWQRVIHEIIHAKRLSDKDNEYLSIDLVSKWVILERIAKAVRQKDFLNAFDFESGTEDSADVKLEKWLEYKKRQFTSENLDQAELDIMTEHVEFRTKFMIDNYNKLSVDDKQRVDELYEIRTYLVALYNDLNANRDYLLPENGYMIPESIGLTPKEAEAIVWPSMLSGLIADIDSELRKIMTPTNFWIKAIYSTESDTA